MIFRKQPRTARLHWFRLFVVFFIYGVVSAERCGKTTDHPLGRNGFHFYKFANASSLENCINSCCEEEPCEIAFLLESRCFGLACQRKPEICHQVADQLVRSNEHRFDGAQHKHNYSRKGFIKHAVLASSPSCPGPFATSFTFQVPDTDQNKKFTILHNGAITDSQCKGLCCQSFACDFAFVEEGRCYGVSFLSNKKVNADDVRTATKTYLQMAIIDRKKEVERSVEDTDDADATSDEIDDNNDDDDIGSEGQDSKVSEGGIPIHHFVPRFKNVISNSKPGNHNNKSLDLKPKFETKAKAESTGTQIDNRTEKAEVIQAKAMEGKIVLHKNNSHNVKNSSLKVVKTPTKIAEKQRYRSVPEIQRNVTIDLSKKSYLGNDMKKTSSAAQGEKHNTLYGLVKHQVNPLNNAKSLEIKNTTNSVESKTLKNVTAAHQNGNVVITKVVKKQDGIEINSNISSTVTPNVITLESENDTDDVGVDDDDNPKIIKLHAAKQTENLVKIKLIPKVNLKSDKDPHDLEAEDNENTNAKTAKQTRRLNDLTKEAFKGSHKSNYTGINLASNTTYNENAATAYKSSFQNEKNSSLTSSLGHSTLSTSNSASASPETKPSLHPVNSRVRIYNTNNASQEEILSSRELVKKNNHSIHLLNLTQHPSASHVQYERLSVNVSFGNESSMQNGEIFPKLKLMPFEHAKLGNYLNSNSQKDKLLSSREEVKNTNGSIHVHLFNSSKHESSVKNEELPTSMQNGNTATKNSTQDKQLDNAAQYTKGNYSNSTTQEEELSSSQMILTKSNGFTRHFNTSQHQFSVNKVKLQILDSSLLHETVMQKEKAVDTIVSHQTVNRNTSKMEKLRPSPAELKKDSKPIESHHFSPEQNRSIVKNEILSVNISLGHEAPTQTVRIVLHNKTNFAQYTTRNSSNYPSVTPTNVSTATKTKPENNLALLVDQKKHKHFKGSLTPKMNSTNTVVSKLQSNQKPIETEHKLEQAPSIMNLANQQKKMKEKTIRIGNDYNAFRNGENEKNSISHYAELKKEVKKFLNKTKSKSKNVTYFRSSSGGNSKMSLQSKILHSPSVKNHKPHRAVNNIFNGTSAKMSNASSAILSAKNMFKASSAKKISHTLSAKKLSETSSAKKMSYPSTAMKISHTLSDKKLSETSSVKKLSNASTTMKISNDSLAKKISHTLSAKKMSNASRAKKLSNATTPKKMSYASTAMKISHTLSAKKMSNVTSAKKISIDASLTTIIEDNVGTKKKKQHHFRRPTVKRDTLQQNILDTSTIKQHKQLLENNTRKTKLNTIKHHVSLFDSEKVSKIYKTIKMGTKKAGDSTTKSATFQIMADNEKAAKKQGTAGKSRNAIKSAVSPNQLGTDETKVLKQDAAKQMENSFKINTAPSVSLENKSHPDESPTHDGSDESKTVIKDSNKQTRNSDTKTKMEPKIALETNDDPDELGADDDDDIQVYAQSIPKKLDPATPHPTVKLPRKKHQISAKHPQSLSRIVAIDKPESVNIMMLNKKSKTLSKVAKKKTNPLKEAVNTSTSLEPSQSNRRKLTTKIISSVLKSSNSSSTHGKVNKTSSKQRNIPKKEKILNDKERSKKIQFVETKNITGKHVVKGPKTIQGQRTFKTTITSNPPKPHGKVMKGHDGNDLIPTAAVMKSKQNHTTYSVVHKHDHHKPNEKSQRKVKESLKNSSSASSGILTQKTITTTKNEKNPRILHEEKSRKIISTKTTAKIPFLDIQGKRKKARLSRVTLSKAVKETSILKAENQSKKIRNDKIHGKIITDNNRDAQKTPKDAIKNVDKASLKMKKKGKERHPLENKSAQKTPKDAIKNVDKASLKTKKKGKERHPLGNKDVQKILKDVIKNVDKASLKMKKKGRARHPLESNAAPRLLQEKPKSIAAYLKTKTDLKMADATVSHRKGISLKAKVLGHAFHYNSSSKGSRKMLLTKNPYLKQGKTTNQNVLVKNDKMAKGATNDSLVLPTKKNSYLPNLSPKLNVNSREKGGALHFFKVKQDDATGFDVMENHPSQHITDGKARNSINLLQSKSIIKHWNGTLQNMTKSGNKKMNNNNNTNPVFLRHFVTIPGVQDSVLFSSESHKKHKSKKKHHHVGHVNPEEIGDSDFDILMSNDIPHKKPSKHSKKKSTKHKAFSGDDVSGEKEKHKKNSKKKKKKKKKVQKKKKSKKKKKENQSKNEPWFKGHIKYIKKVKKGHDGGRTNSKKHNKHKTFSHHHHHHHRPTHADDDDVEEDHKPSHNHHQRKHEKNDDDDDNDDDNERHVVKKHHIPHHRKKKPKNNDDDDDDSSSETERRSHKTHHVKYSHKQYQGEYVGHTKHHHKKKKYHQESRRKSHHRHHKYHDEDDEENDNKRIHHIKHRYHSDNDYHKKHKEDNDDERHHYYHHHFHHPIVYHDSDDERHIKHAPKKSRVFIGEDSDSDDDYAKKDDYDKRKEEKFMSEYDKWLKHKKEESRKHFDHHENYKEEHPWHGKHFEHERYHSYHPSEEKEYHENEHGYKKHHDYPEHEDDIKWKTEHERNEWREKQRHHWRDHDGYEQHYREEESHGFHPWNIKNKDQDKSDFARPWENKIHEHKWSHLPWKQNDLREEELRWRENHHKLFPHGDGYPSNAPLPKDWMDGNHWNDMGSKSTTPWPMNKQTTYVNNGLQYQSTPPYQNLWNSSPQPFHPTRPAWTSNKPGPLDQRGNPPWNGYKYGVNTNTIGQNNMFPNSTQNNMRGYPQATLRPQWNTIPNHQPGTISKPFMQNPNNSLWSENNNNQNVHRDVIPNPNPMQPQVNNMSPGNAGSVGRPLNQPNASPTKNFSTLKGFFHSESKGAAPQTQHPAAPQSLPQPQPPAQPQLPRPEQPAAAPVPAGVPLPPAAQQPAPPVPRPTPPPPHPPPPPPPPPPAVTTTPKPSTTPSTTKATTQPTTKATTRTTTPKPSTPKPTEEDIPIPPAANANDIDDIEGLVGEQGSKQRKHRDPVCKAGKITDDMTLMQGKRAGNFTKIGDIGNFELCIKRCCQTKSCDLAYKSGDNCYLVHCKSKDTCQVTPALIKQYSPKMCFVRRSTDEPKDLDDDNNDDNDDKPDEDKHDKDKMSPAGIREVCKAEKALAINWKKTSAGHYSIVPCPRHAKGSAKRRCGADSRWQNPDFSDCVMHDYMNIYEKSHKLASGADAQPLIRDLSQLTTQTLDNSLIFGGDLIKSAEVMSAIVQHNGQNDLLEMEREDMENFITSSSNLLDLTNKQEWFNVQQTKPGSANILHSMEMFSLQAAMRLPRADTKKSFMTNNIILKLDRRSSRSGRLIFPDYSDNSIAKWDVRHDIISIPSSVFKGEVSSASMIYKSLPDILPNVNSSSGLGPNSKIVSTILHPAPPEKISPPVTIILSHIKLKRPNPKCVFWDYSINPHRGGGWSSRGCKLVSSNETHSVCQCSHLSNFCLLADLSNDEISAKEQKRERTMALMWIGIPVLIVGIIGGLYMSFSWTGKSQLSSSVSRPINEKTGLLGQRVVTSQVREEFPASPSRHLYRALSPAYTPVPKDLEWQHDFGMAFSGDEIAKKIHLPQLEIASKIMDIYDKGRCNKTKEIGFHDNECEVTPYPSSPTRSASSMDSGYLSLSSLSLVSSLSSNMSSPSSLSPLSLIGSTTSESTIHPSPYRYSSGDIEFEYPRERSSSSISLSSTSSLLETPASLEILSTLPSSSSSSSRDTSSALPQSRTTRVRFAEDPLVPSRLQDDDDEIIFQRLQELERRVFTQRLQRSQAVSNLYIDDTTNQT